MLFFAVQSLTATNIFGTSLDSHLHHQDWSALAQELRRAAAGRRGTTLRVYAPTFDQAVVLHAKSLVILMVLPFPPLLPLCSRVAASRRMGHGGLFSSPLRVLDAALLGRGLVAAVERGSAGGLASPRVDNVLSLINVAACAAYLYLAMGPAYGASGGVRVSRPWYWRRPPAPSFSATGSCSS